jgi:hypothetical protein
LDEKGKPVLDKAGRKRIEVLRVPVLDHQGNQIIENGEVKQNVKTEKRHINPFRQLLNRLGSGERIDGVNHSRGQGLPIGIPPIVEHREFMNALSDYVTTKLHPYYLNILNDRKALTYYGRTPIDQASPLMFYQSARNEGLTESPEKIVVGYASTFMHPDSKLVGGLNGFGKKHPSSSGWYPSGESSGELNQIPFVNAAAPYSYRTRENPSGINITGGDPNRDGVSITRETIEANLKACGLQTSYKDFLKQLPFFLEGSSYASPWLLAENFKGYIAKAVQANEGKLPRGLEPEFHQRLETLGIKIPVQGEPQYNPKK